MTSAPPPAQVGDEFECTVGRPATGGGFVARAPDGRVVFVRHAVAGERVRARVTEVTRSYLRADAIEILSASPDRVTPTCPISGPGGCGGCDYQHIALQAQRRFKAMRVQELLASIAEIAFDHAVQPVAGDEAGLAWRTRATFAVDESGRAGFYRHRSHEIVEVERCPLVTGSLDALAIGQARWPGVRTIDVHSSASDRSVVAVFGEPGASVPRLDADLVVNGQAQQGSGTITHLVHDRRFRVSPNVFWQVHPGAAVTLADAVRRAAGNLDGANVLDCYCGAGLFSINLADSLPAPSAVWGIEQNAGAVRDAKRNARHLDNVTILNHTVSADYLRSVRFAPDIVVLDPPRSGAGRPLMRALCAMKPQPRVVYVACDPATFARDARVLLDASYVVDSLEAYDCFPMTEHVELVAAFSPPAGRRGAGERASRPSHGRSGPK